MPDLTVGRTESADRGPDRARQRSSSSNSGSTAACCRGASHECLSQVIRAGIVLDHESFGVEPDELWWTPRPRRSSTSPYAWSPPGPSSTRSAPTSAPHGRHRPTRPAAAQRPPLLPAARARAGLLAAEPPRRRPRSMPSRLEAESHQGPGLQRPPHAPDQRRSALPRRCATGSGWSCSPTRRPPTSSPTWRWRAPSPR